MKFILSTLQLGDRLKFITVFVIFCLFANNARSADYYWVGGQGNWSEFSTHWATTSDGSTFHTSVPTLADDVYFDAFSFSVDDTVFIDVVGNCQNLYITSAAGVIFANNTLNCAGTFDVLYCFFHSNGNTINVDKLDLSSSSFLGSRTFDVANSTINISGSGLAYDLEHSFNLSEDFTNTIFNFNYVGFSSVSANVGGSNLAYSEFNINTTSFTFGENAVIDTVNVVAGCDFNITEGLAAELNVYEINFNGNCGTPVYLSSTSSNEAYLNIRGQTLNATNLVILDINGTNGTFNATNSIDQGGNTNWSINENPSNVTYYWVGGTGDWSDPGHWSLTSGGAADACVPGPSDTVFFDVNSGSGFTTTVDLHSYCGTMIWNGVLGNPDLAGANDLTLKGSLMFDANMTATMTGNYNFISTTAASLTSAGVVFNGDVHFTEGAGTYGFADDFTSNNDIYLELGDLSTNGNTLTIDGFVSYPATARTFDMTNSTIVITGTGDAWYINPTGIGLTSTDSDVSFNHANTNLSIMDGGGLDYADFSFYNAQSEIRGDNTFGMLYFNEGITINIETGTDQTVDTIIAVGTCLAPITIQCTNNNSPPGNFTYNNSGLLDTMEVYYCNIYNVTASSVLLGAYYRANNSNLEYTTTGWNATGSIIGTAYYWVNDGGDWSDITHWESPAGTPATCLPTIKDTVYFDANSFTTAAQTVNTDIEAACFRMDWTGSNGFNPVLNLTGSLSIREDAILNSTVSITNSDTLAQLRFIPDINTAEFTTFNRPVHANVFYEGSNALLDTFKLNGNLFMDDNSALTLGQGAFNSNSDSIQCGVFQVSGVNARYIHLHASVIEVKTGISLIDFSVPGNLVNLFPGTSHFHLLGSAELDYFAGDDQTFNDVTIYPGTGSYSSILSGSNIYNNFTLEPGLTIVIDSAETQTVNGLFTAVATCNDSIFVSSSGAVTATTFDLAAAGSAECINAEGINITTTPLTAFYSSDLGNNNASLIFDPTNSTDASYTVPFDVCLGDPVTFTNTSVAVSGGIGVLTFEWEFDDDTLTTDTSSLQDPTYTYTTNGKHYATLTSYFTNGCSNTYLDSVRVNDPTFTMTISESDTTTCQGDTVTFTASAFSGTGTVTYDFQVNNVSTQNSAANVFITPNLNNNDVVTCIMNANGCLDTTDYVYTMTVHPNPVVSMTTSVPGDVICDGDLVNFTGSGAEKYQFYIDGSPVTFLTTNNIHSTTTLVNGNVVTLIGIDTLTGCFTEAPEISTMTVNALPSPTMTTSDGDLVICDGDFVSFTAANAVQYEFFINGVSVQGPSATASYGTTGLNNLDNITVVGYENNCPATSPDDFTYFVNDIPNTILSNNTGTTICEGTTVTFTGYFATTYEFFLNGTSVQGPSGNPTYTNGGLTTGDQIYVDGTSNGCAQNSSTSTFTVNALPSVTLVCSDPDSTICQGDTVTFTAGGADLYQYYLNGVPLGPSSTVNTYTTSTLANGDIVKVRGFQSGCSAFGPVEFPMTVIPEFNVNLFDSDSDNSICFGESVTFTGTGTAITSFELFVDGVSHTVNGTGSFPVSNLPIGNPQISLSGSKLGCTYFADDTLSFTVNAIPTVDMTSNDVDNVICDGDSLIYFGTGASTYEFTINGVSQGVSAIDTLYSDGFNNGDVIDLIGYVGGCSSNSLTSFTITVDPVPPTVLSSSDINNIICAGESITYTASGADNYEFFIDGVSQGAPSTNTILTSSSFTGTLNIYVVGYNTGCSGTSNDFDLIVNELPDIAISISDADTSVCDGETVTFTGSGAGTYELMINGVSQGPATINNVFNINNLVDGDQVTMQGDGINGCFNTSPDLFDFTVIPNPSVSMTSSDADSSICVGETVTFTASGASSYIYYVNGTQATTGVTYTTDSLTNGQIVQIYGTDNICSTFGNSIPYAVYSYPVTSIISDDVDETICQGDQVVFTGQGAFDFEFFVNGVSVQGPSTQDSLITTSINDDDIITVDGGNNGCTTLSSGITYTVNQYPITTLTSSDVDNQICFGDQVDFTSGGGDQYEFYINGISQDPVSALNTFSTVELNDQDVVSVLGYVGECAAFSTTITMGVDVMPIVLDVVPGNIICVGDQVDFTGTGADTYEFFIDGVSVQGPGATNTYSTTALTDGQVVSLEGFLAATGCTQFAPTSQLFVVMDNPVITALSATTICEGDSVVLVSDYSVWNQWYMDGSPLGGETDTSYEAYLQGQYHTEVTLGGVDEVWALGNNVDGQLGDNSTNSSLSAVETIGMTGIVELEAGMKYNLARDNSGAVYAWGENTQGQLGDGTFTSSVAPVAMSITNAVDVSAGHEFGLAALSTGAVMSWGRNNLGQLGQGNFATTNFPFAVTGLTGMVAVAGGENHALALKDDGTVYSWGNNTFGQLGLGDFVDYNSPQLIPGLTGIASIHTGDNHSFAVDSSGALYVWGSNAHGQLGINGILFSETPIQNPIPNVQAADGGTDHSIVLTTNQKVYTFGNNDYGQLGNGTLISEYNPQKMDTLDAVIHVEAAFYQSGVIKGDNSTWTWGRNDAGQLGTENTIQQNEPNYIPNLTGAGDFGLGQDHTAYIVTQENSCASNTIDVIVNPEPEVTITSFGGLFTATPPGDSYQWYIDGIIIPGGTTQSIVPTTFGWYTCEVTYPGGCTSLSDAYPWGVVGINDLDAFAFSVYPNPSYGVFNIQGDFYKFENFEVTVLNVLGQEVYSEEFNAIGNFVSIDLDAVERGTYTVRITSQGTVIGMRRVVLQ
ncbi:MAG: T9SS type A sorting domain-containing protein [Crocinitomicaceae bacterium]